MKAYILKRKSDGIYVSSYGETYCSWSGLKSEAMPFRSKRKTIKAALRLKEEHLVISVSLVIPADAKEKTIACISGT